MMNNSENSLHGHIEWKIDPQLVPYPLALATMDERVAMIAAGTATELVWLLQHPPLYTAGTSAKDSDLLADSLPVYDAGRGGQYTYHGPGQIIAYPLLNLARRGLDIRAHIWRLEEWAIRALADFGITALRRCGRVGLWVPENDQRDNKIAAIGVRVRRQVTMHGIAINLSPALEHYQGIIPCGINQHGVTSAEKLGVTISFAAFSQSLQQHWADIFDRPIPCTAIRPR